MFERNFGYISFDKKTKRYSLVINLKKISKNCTGTDSILFISDTIAHELEHIKCIKSFYCSSFKYEYFMSLLEYISLCNEKKLLSNLLVSDVIYTKIKYYFNYLSNYNILVSEIQSNLVSSIKTVCEFKKLMSVEKLKEYYLKINTYKIIKNSNCIFSINGSYFDKSIVFVKTEELIKRNKFLLKEFPILSNTYNDDGSLKEIYDIYLTSMKNNNIEMFSDLMIELLFIQNDINLSDSEFCSYIVDLIYSYFDNIDYYLKNNFICNFYVDGHMLKENSIFLLKRVQYLLDRYSFLLTDEKIERGFDLCQKMKNLR